MVFHGIDKNRRASEILQDGRHVGVQWAADGIGDDGFAVLCAVNEVDVKAGERLWHGLGRLFRALGCGVGVDLGRCPRLA